MVIPKQFWMATGLRRMCLPSLEFLGLGFRVSKDHFGGDHVARKNDLCFFGGIPAKFALNLNPVFSLE